MEEPWDVDDVDNVEEPRDVDDVDNVESGEEELLVFGPDFLIPVETEEDMGDLNTCESSAGLDELMTDDDENDDDDATPADDDDADDDDKFSLSVHPLGLALMASTLGFSLASCSPVNSFPASSLQFALVFTKSLCN